MSTKIEVLSHRLELLLDGVNFRSDFEKALGSPEQLMAIGEHNTHEYEKIESMGEEIQERIQNLFASIIADRLQEETIARYGNTDSGSIRQVLLGWFNRSDGQEFEDRLRDAAKQALLRLDFTEEQCASIMVHIYDQLPNMLIEYIEESIEPIHMLPRSESQLIVMALADMMREEVS